MSTKAEIIMELKQRSAIAYKSYQNDTKNGSAAYFQGVSAGYDIAIQLVERIELT